MIRFFLMIIILSLLSEGKGQGISSNICDSNFLNKEQYEKCIEDSSFAPMIYQVVNHLSYYKTVILPKYRMARTGLVIPDSIQKMILELKKLYDSTLKEKSWVYGNDMNKNMKYVSPKSNILSLITFEYFKIYPDVYAVMLNDIHTILNPASSLSDIERFKGKIQHLLGSLPDILTNQVYEITAKMQIEKNKYDSSMNWRGFLQGTAEESEREKYRMIDFLLWDK